MSGIDRCVLCGLPASALIHHATANGHYFETAGTSEAHKQHLGQ